MFALQAARAAVKTGRSAVFFSYELEADSLSSGSWPWRPASSTRSRPPA